METQQFEYLRPEEILAERERCPVAYLPIGPLEWHGLHLPFGTDALNAQAVARLAASKTGGVVLPTLFCGTERERPPEKLRALGLDEQAYVVGMDFPGNLLPSLYFPEEIFSLIVRAHLDLLVRLDYRLIVLVNGHGARNQIETLRRLSKEYSARPGVYVQVAFAFPASSSANVGHADASETSIVMALAPKRVDLSALPDPGIPISMAATGIVDSASFRGESLPDHTLPATSDPRLHASPVWGQEILMETASEVASMVERSLQNIRNWESKKKT